MCVWYFVFEAVIIVNFFSTKRSGSHLSFPVLNLLKQNNQVCGKAMNETK